MKQDKNPMLEAVLAKQMGPVKAPDALWSRIQNPRQQVQSSATSMWVRWAPIAATLVLVAGGMWWVRNLGDQPTTREAMAVAALGGSEEELSLRTSDTAEIRRWVRANSGIDIPLPPKHDSVIQVIGARMVNGPDQLAEVSYQVGDYRAALLVAKDPTGKKSYPTHGLRPSDPLEKAHVSSWSMRGQSYTLASDARAEEFETTCLLCHDQTPSLPSAARKI